MGKVRDAYKSLVELPAGKIPSGRPKRRWKDNIRMDLREIRWLRTEVGGGLL
jgi:hypothetical protein